MSKCGELYVGFDPGGKNAFGWAVARSMPSGLELLHVGTCNFAAEAVEAAAECCEIQPAAFGTDAPLFWVDSGNRNADDFVRKLVCAAGGNSGTVNHVNSLRGACLVQGIQVARLASARWPASEATEAHPKALLLVDNGAGEFFRRIEIELRNDHERDAAVAAYTAAALVNQADGWHDLVCHENNPFFPGGSKIAYWFPRMKT